MKLRQTQHETLAIDAEIERRVRERTADLEQQLGTLRALVDAVPVALWLKDRAGRYLAVNDAHARAHGLSIAQMVGASDDALALHASQEIETFPVFGDDGTPIGSAGVARDLCKHRPPEVEYAQTNAELSAMTAQLQSSVQTLMRRIGENDAKSEAQRQNAQRLRNANDFAESVISAIPDLLFEVDGEGRYLGVWGQNSELLAAPEEALISRTVHETLPPEAAQIAMSALREAADSGYSFGKAYRLTLPSGEYWFELSVASKPGLGSAPPTFIAIARDISERRRADEIAAQRDREKRLANIAANLPGFLYKLRRSPDGFFSFPYVSSGVRELCGLDADELARSAAPLLARICADDRPVIVEKIGRSVREMSLFDATVRIDVPGRGERWISSRAMPHEDGAGGIRWYGVMLDVSEQQQLKYQLNLSQFALDRVHEAFFLIADLRLVYVNDEACRALGYRRDELLALRIGDIDPDDSPERVESMRRAMNTHGWCRIESRHRRRDGSVFPVAINASLFKYRGASFTVALVRDLSEQKRAEGKIAASERNFRTLAEGLPDSIARYDREGTLVYINAALNKELGDSAAGAIGKRVREWKPDGSFEAYAQALDAVLATGQQREIELCKPDPRVESDHVCQIHFVAERDENATVIGALAIGRDISALKRTKRELENSRSELRGLVARSEKTRETERKRIAREVHDVLGQILTGVQMNVSRLARKVAAHTPALLGQVHETMELTEKALSVTRNVVKALRPAVLDLGIVAALEWLAERYAANTGITCQVHIDDGDIDVGENQAIALFRIAQESLTNVARHAQASRVDIALYKTAADYTLEIRDNGAGFETSSRKTNSFGLLGIRERAFILGGTVRIDSRLGGGTQVVVQLPCHGIEEQS